MFKSKLGIMRTYDSIASDFNITRYKPWPSTEKFANHFEKGDLILDLGCGNGRDLRHFESKGIKIVGLDISSEQLKVVRARAKEVPMLVRGDVCELPFGSGSARGAILVATLHHLVNEEERVNALCEVHRCLKNGGRCLAGVWAREQKKFEENMDNAKSELGEAWEAGDMLLDWKMPSGTIFKRYYHLFSEEEFDGLLGRTPFTVVGREFVCDNHYAVLEKR